MPQTAQHEADIINPRSLIPPELYGRLVTRIAAEHNLSSEYADRIMSQTLAFLAACAFTGRPLTPSATVDIGWHAFILFTREYAEFCQRVAGRFLHHVPDDEQNASWQGDNAERLGVTVEAMRAAGLPVDVELWLTNGKCSQCYAGCVSDPRKV